MRVLVCGGRDFADAALLQRTLDDLPISILMQGGAMGADTLAKQWGEERSLIVDTFHADWERHGRSAGPKRNQWMLDDGKPELVVAFKGGRGTADMVKRAKAAGVPVLDVAA